MEMRQLTSKDIFPMCQIIKKIGIDEFKQCFSTPEVLKMVTEDGGTGKVANQIGISIMFDIVSIIVGNLPKCKDEIYNFLASLTGSSSKELEELPLADFTQLIVDLVQKEEFKDFIGVVSKLFK